MDIALHTVIVFLGAAGFSLSRYIHKHKRHGKPMVCPLDFDCHTVIHSKYSKFIGIPLEYWGMAYYAVIFFAYASFIFAKNWYTNDIAASLLALTTTAFLFSLYLTSIQALILKEWCTWCLFSASICTLIFILAYAASDITSAYFIDFFTNLSWFRMLQ